MTQKFIIIPTFFLLVIAVMAVAPLLANIEIPTFSAPVAPEDNINTTYNEIHSNPAHDVTVIGSEGQKITQAMIFFWPGNGPDGKEFICATIYVLKEGTKIVARTVYWRETVAGSGDLAWFNHLTGQWGGAYPDKVRATVGNLPLNLKADKNYSIQGGCKDHPTPPPFQPAT